MKRLFSISFAVLLVCVLLVGCGSKEVDYPNVADFEAALNNGEDLTGKTVTFTVNDYVPDSLFGHNLQAGEHLNFCSSDAPGINKGDTVTVEVISVSSILESHIIKYKVVN